MSNSFPKLLIVATVLASCNLAWTSDPKTYTPAPAQTIEVDGFGIDGDVDVLNSGQLPVTITRTLINTGPLAVDAGYTVTETVKRLRFVAVNPVLWEWVEVNDPAFTYFECSTTGPALASGQSADITFTFPGPDCAPPAGRPTPAVLDCGLYKETLVTDAGGGVLEINEGDNDTDHFFFVPSSQGRLNMTRTANPTGDPDVTVVATPPPPTVQIPAFRYPPPPNPQTVTAWSVRIFSAPATAGWIVNGISPRTGPLSGATGALVPPMQIIDPAPAAPRTVTYDVTFDPLFVGPSGSGFYVENLDSKVTAITTDGCQIRQRSLKTQVVFERRSP